MNTMNHHCDPHLRKQEEFGVPGNTVRLGKHTYVGCIVIGAPPHSNCPMYKENMARHEKMYRKKIVNSGEYGTRDNTIKRLGFHFKDKKKEKWKERRADRGEKGVWWGNERTHKIRLFS